MVSIAFPAEFSRERDFPSCFGQTQAGPQNGVAGLRRSALNSSALCATVVGSDTIFDAGP